MVEVELDLILEAFGLDGDATGLLLLLLNLGCYWAAKLETEAYQARFLGGP